MRRSVCPGFASDVVITEPCGWLERVDVQPLRAGDAAQVAVVRRLDAALADLVAGLVAPTIARLVSWLREISPT